MARPSPVGSKPAGIALSADGSTLYVANGDDSVSVVDTKTRSVFGVMTLDNAPENNLHAVAVRGDGSLLVTNLADRAVRIVNYKRGNTAPVATGSPRPLALPASETAPSLEMPTSRTGTGIRSHTPR